MFIGEKIAEMRKANKMTQRELAEKLNVSDKVISKWETGKSLPDVETMPRISKVLGISISEIYECVEEANVGIAEDYNEERIWQYKKYSIASCFLVLISPILFFLTGVDWTGFYDIKDLLNFSLTMSSIATFVLGIFFQLTQFVRLYSYSKDKYYKEKYNKVMKKYGIIFLSCLAIIIVFFFILWIISIILF